MKAGWSMEEGSARMHGDLSGSVVRGALIND
jgi:hypothetical protein